MVAKKTRLRFDVISIFPPMVEGAMAYSVIGRAQETGLIEVNVHDLRSWAEDERHKKIDDRPFGGGPGMVIKAEPVYRALKSLGAMRKVNKPWVVYLSPQGKRFAHSDAVRLSKRRQIILLCGHYEGIDERIMPWIDEEISIGDVVLTGGEIPAMVVIDATSRFVSGVVGDPESVANDSFSTGLLDYPHFTRPQVWRGKAVPKVLTSGNLSKIADWRNNEAIRNTKLKRSDLLNKF